MRISDWSSDVCSSDLLRHSAAKRRRAGRRGHAFAVDDDRAGKAVDRGAIGAEAHPTRGDLRVGKDPGAVVDRKSVVSGKSVSVRVDLGGRRIIKKKKIHIHSAEMTISQPVPTK